MFAMRKTIREIIREQEGTIPIIDIMGNPTTKVFDDPVPETRSRLTFAEFLKEGTYIQLYTKPTSNPH